MSVAVFGGGSRIRTGDPMLAKHVLYQLSYTPLMPGALPLNTPRPFRLSDFLTKVPARPAL